MSPVSLVRGKFIDTIDGVVDTWQWFINKISGIKAGDGIEVKHTDDGVEITAKTPDIYAGDGIKVTKDDTGGIEIALADDGEEEELPELPMLDLSGLLSNSDVGPFKFTAGQNGSLTFANRYYSVGGKTYEVANNTPLVVTYPCVVYLKLNATASSGAVLASAATMAALQATQQDTDYYCIPLYSFDVNGALTCDFRNMPTAAMGEF